LRQRFRELLTGWALEAEEEPIAMPTVEELLVTLLNARNELLREELLEVLHSRAFERSETLHALAIRVQATEEKSSPL
jgi:hypothetical protein